MANYYVEPTAKDFETAMCRLDNIGAYNIRVVDVLDGGLYGTGNFLCMNGAYGVVVSRSFSVGILVVLSDGFEEDYLLKMVANDQTITATVRFDNDYGAYALMHIIANGTKGVTINGSIFANETLNDTFAIDAGVPFTYTGDYIKVPAYANQAAIHVLSGDGSGVTRNITVGDCQESDGAFSQKTNIQCVRIDATGGINNLTIDHVASTDKFGSVSVTGNDCTNNIVAEDVTVSGNKNCIMLTGSGQTNNIDVSGAVAAGAVTAISISGASANNTIEANSITGGTASGAYGVSVTGSASTNRITAPTIEPGTIATAYGVMVVGDGHTDFTGGDYGDISMTTEEHDALIAVHNLVKSGGGGDLAALKTTVDTNLDSKVSEVPTASYTVSSSTVGVASVVDLIAYQYTQLGPYTITASTSQSGDSHSLLVYSYGSPSVVLWSLTTAAGEITVGGTDSKTLTIVDTDAHTSTNGVFAYILRNTTDDTIICEGSLTIAERPNVPSA
jgi:hypothetical protein